MKTHQMNSLNKDYYFYIASSTDQDYGRSWTIELSGQTIKIYAIACPYPLLLVHIKYGKQRTKVLIGGSQPNKKTRGQWAHSQDGSQPLYWMAMLFDRQNAPSIAQSHQD